MHVDGPIDASSGSSDNDDDSPSPLRPTTLRDRLNSEENPMSLVIKNISKLIFDDDTYKVC